MPRRTRAAALFTVLLCIGLAAHAAPRYRFEAIATPTGAELLGVGDLNDAGQISAVWLAAGGAGNYRASLYSPDSGHATIGAGSYDTLEVLGLNASGTVVGALGLPEGQRAYRFTESAPVGGLTANGRSAATAINDAGVTGGYFQRADGLAQPWVAATGEAPREIGLPDGGAVIGLNNTGEALIAGYGGPGFPISRYDLATGTLTRVGEGLDAITSARLNDAGDIAVTAGWRFTSAGVFHGDGSFTALAGLPGFSDGQAFDLNDRGQVLGASYNGGPGIPFERRDFLYTPGEGFIDVLAQVEVPDGWDGLSLSRINNRGDILGTGYFDGAQRIVLLRALAAPVPEPAAAVLLALGVAGVAVARRRQASPAAAC